MSYQSRDRLIAEAELSSRASSAPEIRPRQGIVRRAVFVLALWQQRRVMRRDLARMDARSLRDAGISPAAAAFECGKPFWREMGPLR